MNDYTANTLVFQVAGQHIPNSAKRHISFYPMPSPLAFDLSSTLEERAGFDEIVDVRSPAEFTEDHIPGALNCPVLNNEERHEVGTI